MDPAPGYDPFLPHDLIHFLVECEWGIGNGIFGQLAAGGDAGTFWTTRRDIRRRWRRRGKRLRAAAGGDSGRSERIAHLAFVAWQARHGQAVNPWDVESVRETLELDPAILERTLARFDEIAERWHALGVGGSITLTWPWSERPPKSGARSKRRRHPARRSPSRGTARTR